MLAIEREPLYKNRILLSSLAVVAGFVVTVGIIRAVTPNETAGNQSAQTSSERRASSLIPINASDSESASESDDTAKKASAAAGSTTAAPASGSTPWTTSGTQSSAAQSGTPQSQQASSASTPTPSTQPQPTEPSSPSCVGLPVAGSLVCTP